MYDWHICIALSLLIYVIQVNEHFKSNSNILILNLGLNIYLSVPWYVHEFIKYKWVKWRHVRPSMVTHTRNSCSACNPS